MKSGNLNFLELSGSLQAYNILFICIRGWEDPRAGGIISMKNSSNAFGNQIRHLSACSEVSQPTSSLLTPCFTPSLSKNLLHVYMDNIQ